MMPYTSKSLRTAAAFTLLELLVAMSLMVIALTITYASFSAVSKAWQRGVALADRINRGDFVMDQLAAAIRSAYYPDSAGGAGGYGFWLEDRGGGAYASDEISWVKQGKSLIDSAAPYADAPHRVLFSIESGFNARRSVAVRGWRAYGQPDDFSFSDVDPLFLTSKVTGFDCRIATNMINDEVDWHSDWDETNRLPAAVELTLYLEPVDDGEPPVKIIRAVGIPAAPMSWRF